MKTIAFYSLMLSTSIALACGEVEYKPFLPKVWVNGKYETKPELLENTELINRVINMAIKPCNMPIVRKNKILLIENKDKTELCVQNILDRVMDEKNIKVELTKPNIQIDTVNR